jgi:hypothetical protein
MNQKIAMCGLLAAALVFGTACKKGDAPGGAASTEAPPPSAPAPAPAPAAGEVATYPNQIPQGGTVVLKVPFTVHQAADPASPVLSNLGVGTFVDLKASFSNWMLVNWPSGVGQLSPGWIQLPNIGDSRVTVHQKDAGVAASASAPATVSAAPSTGRPVIKIPPKH